MSDGDNATPGRPPPRRARGTTSHMAYPIAAAEARRRAVGARTRRTTTDADADPTAHTPQSGNHTDGVTVADLIAKVSGDTATDERAARAEPPQPPTTPPDPEPWPSTPTPGRARIARRRTAQPTSTPPPRSFPRCRPATPSSRCCRRNDRRAATPTSAGAAHARARSATACAPAMIVGRVAAALIAVLALAMTGAAWQWQASKNGNLNKVAALDPNSRDIVDPNAQFGDENFLIVGIDSRIGANSDMGAGTTDDAAGARSDTIMLVNIPANRKRVVAVSFPRDLAITPHASASHGTRHRRVRPDHRRGNPDVRDGTGLHRDQAELRLRPRRAQVSGEGNPEDVRAVDQPVHGGRLRRLLQDGRRARRGRGVQHHAAGGLRARHGAGQRRSADHRRPHRPEVRARPPGHHRDQRRLRPHQAPAAVPVVTVAVDDLQGSSSRWASSTTSSTCSSTTPTSTTSRPRISSTSGSRSRASTRAASPS